MLIKNILLVDNNPSVLEVYQNILKKEGYDVDIAENGELALEMLNTFDYQIIITDIRFPQEHIDGFKIIEKAKYIHPNCELIVMANYSDLDLIMKVMNLDVSNFIPKPCSKADIILAIKRASEKLEMRHLVKEYTKSLKHIVDKKNQEIASIEEKLLHVTRLSLIGQMSASVCHELRQPLCSIMGFIYLLAQNIPEDAIARKYLKNIEEQAIYMEQILNNMGSFSRKSEGAYTSLSINEVVRSVLSFFYYELKNNNIELIEDMDESIPIVEGNKVKLQQVIINLLANARDALHDIHNRKTKRIYIKTYYDNADQRAKISVSDNGIGIDKALFHKIFQPFFTTKEEGKGTGLGLSISKNILSDFAGEIKFKSQRGRGSTFTISIPVIKDATYQNSFFIEKSDNFIKELEQLNVILPEGIL